MSTFLQLIRQPGIPIFDSVWAEDGTLFFDQAVNGEDFLSILVEPYSGYALIVPRLLTDVGLLFGVDTYAMWVAVTSSVIVGLLGLFCFYAVREVIPSVFLRGLLLLAVVFQPILTQEVSASFANLQWYFVFPVFVALFIPVVDVKDWTCRLILVAVTPLFVPLSLLFVPFVPLRYLYLRQRSYAILGLVFCLAASIQFVIMLNADTSPPLGNFSTEVSLRVFAERILTQFVFSVESVNYLWDKFGWGFTAFNFVVLAIGLGASLIRSNAQTRVLVASLLVACVGLFFFSLYKRAGVADLMASQSSLQMNFGAGRYQVAPLLFLVTAILIAVAQVDLSSVYFGKRQLLFSDLIRFLPVTLLLVAFSTNIIAFRPEGSRSSGPRWSKQIKSGQVACLRTRAKSVNLAVAPGGPWVTKVPCSDLP